MSDKEVLVLVTKFFDEISTVYCLCHMREEGLSTRLVGLHSGLQTGLRGLKLRPDLDLMQIDPETTISKNHTLVLAGGQDCIARLQSDPRVYSIVESILEKGGFIAVMAQTVESGLCYFRAPHVNLPSPFLIQGELDTAQFVDKVIDAVLV